MASGAHRERASLQQVVSSDADSERADLQRAGASDGDSEREALGGVASRSAPSTGAHLRVAQGAPAVMQCEDDVLAKAFEESKHSPSVVPAPSLLRDEEIHGELATAHLEIEQYITLDTQSNGGHAVAQWPRALKLAYPHFTGLSLDRMILALVARSFRNRRELTSEQLLDFAEFWAGGAMLTRECLKRGLRGRRLDKDYYDTHDVLTPLGLRAFLDCQLLLRPRGLCWLGTKCSSFVFICRGPAGRRVDNHWRGDGSKAWVNDGTAQMTIASLMFFLGYLCDVSPVLEQPLGSCMARAAPMSTSIESTRAVKTVTWHGAFGASSLKPLQLWSHRECFQGLRRKRPTIAVPVSLVHKKGNKVSGAKAMQASQAYTPEFGRAVADLVVGLVADTLSPSDLPRHPPLGTGRLS